jgi:hypothetical protein
LPSDLINISGKINLSYGNISDNSLHYSNANISFVALASATSGMKNITLNALGYNLSGSLIRDAANRTLLIESTSINFLCYNVSDGVYVSACGMLDGDYVEPSAVSTSGGGGGGISYVPMQIEEIKSSASFEFVRGGNQAFNFEIKNEHKLPMQNVSIKVSGLNSEYLSIEPSHIESIEPWDVANISVKISAPSYFSQGIYSLMFDIEGFLVTNNTRTTFKEKKKATLYILEMSRNDSAGLLNASMKIIEEMKAKRINTKEAGQLLANSKDAYENLDFLSVKKYYESLIALKENSFESLQIINELYSKINESEKAGIEVSETKKMLFLAETAFERGDFALALERLKEAKLTYALEVKGEFNIFKTIENHPGETAAAFFAVFIVSLSSTLIIRLRLYKRKLRMLHEEEKLLLELMKVVQRECFEKNRMSMEEYREAMRQYEMKLSETIEDKIRIETKIANILKIKGKKKALIEEKNRLSELIKQTQDKYLNKAQLDTRVYERMIRSYSTRLTEIEEQLTFFDAQEALDSNKFSRKILRFLRVRK